MAKRYSPPEDWIEELLGLKPNVLRPDVNDDDGNLRPDITDLNAIVGRLDETCGRNDALVAYIFALRDQQRTIELYATVENNKEEVEAAEANVRAAFSRLISCQCGLLSPSEPRQLTEAEREAVLLYSRQP